MSSNLLERSSFERKARAAGFDDKAWSAERLLAPDFKSARVAMAHQKVPAVPAMAIAASTAVKREAPKKLIAAIRRCSPYCGLPRIHRAAAPWRISEDAYSLLDEKHSMGYFCAAPLRRKFDQTQSFDAARTPKIAAAVGPRVPRVRRSPDKFCGHEMHQTKIRCGLDPNRNCRAARGQQGNASFFLRARRRRRGAPYVAVISWPRCVREIAAPHGRTIQ